MTVQSSSTFLSIRVQNLLLFIATAGLLHFFWRRRNRSGVTLCSARKLQKTATKFYLSHFLNEVNNTVFQQYICQQIEWILLLIGLICSVLKFFLKFLNTIIHSPVIFLTALSRTHFSLHPRFERFLGSGLRHALPGAGPAKAGSAGAAGEHRRGSGGGRLARTAVLEQNINAAFAPGFPGHHHGRLALAVFRLHIDSVPNE